MSRAGRDQAWTILPLLIRRAHLALSQADAALDAVGNGRVSPQAKSTVASMAKLTHRVLELLGLLSEEDPDLRKIDHAAVDATHDIDDVVQEAKRLAENASRGTATKRRRVSSATNKRTRIR